MNDTIQAPQVVAVQTPQMVNISNGKIAVSPKITKIEWDKDNSFSGAFSGEVFASFNLGDKVFDFKQSFFTYDTWKIKNANTEENLITHLKTPDAIRFTNNETVNMLSTVFSFDLMEDAEGKFVQEYIKRWHEVQENFLNDLIKKAKIAWDTNTFVLRKEYVTSHGGKLNFETFEEYQENCVKFSRICSIFAKFEKEVNGKTLCINVSLCNSKKRDMYFVSGSNLCSSNSRPMKWENAILKAELNLVEMENSLKYQVKQKNSREEFLAEFLKKLNDAEINYKACDYKNEVTLRNDFATINVNYCHETKNCYIEGVGGKSYGSNYNGSHILVWTMDEIISFYKDLSDRVKGLNSYKKQE